MTRTVEAYNITNLMQLMKGANIYEDDVYCTMTIMPEHLDSGVYFLFDNAGDSDIRKLASIVYAIYKHNLYSKYEKIQLKIQLCKNRDRVTIFNCSNKMYGMYVYNKIIARVY